MRGFYMKKNRDDFSAATKRDLQKRVNNICSNPDCRKQTIQPQLTNNNKSTNTGRAAHICAAASGGPRFDPNMTEAERKSIDNAIWLCGPCSEIIDREKEAYSVNLLIIWKTNAEAHARLSANQRVYNQIELNAYAQQHILNYFKNPQSLITSSRNPFSLSNLATSITEALFEVDDRICIDVSYIDNTQYFSIKNNPETKNLEPVKIIFKSLPTLDKESKWEDFINHGLPIQIQLESVTSNSEALKIIFPDESDHINALFDTGIDQTLLIKDFNDNLIEEFKGKIFKGKDTFSFKSKIYNNLLSLDIDKISHNLTNSNSFIKINLDSEIWNNEDLISLKKFSQILSFYKKISNLKSIKLYAVCNNRELSIAKLNVNTDEFKYVYNLINYISICRKLAQMFNLTVHFRSNAEFTAEEHKRLHCIFEDAKSIEIQKYEIKNKSNFIINVDNKEQKKYVDKLLETSNGLQLKKEIRELNVKMFGLTFDIEYVVEYEFHNYQLDKKSLSHNSYEIGINFLDNGFFRQNIGNSKVFTK